MLMVESPEVIADDPYGEGWFIKVRVGNPDEALVDTISAEEYLALVTGET
jgi:glycine cleavage system H protein